MRYKEFGQDNPIMIVFLHGGGVGGWMWDKQIGYFASNYHCVVVDMVEYANPKNNTQFTINGAADNVIELIETIGKNKRIVVVGFSLGSQVLIAMLSKKPDLIDYAMINSALVKPLPFAKTLISSMAFMLPLVKKRSFSDLQAKSLYISDDQLDIYYEENLRMNKNTFTSIMSENMSFRLPESFKDNKSKVLITVGQNERKAMKDSALRIAKNSLQSKAIIIPNIGHGFPLANPPLFNALLDMWIESDSIIDDVKVLT